MPGTNGFVAGSRTGGYRPGLSAGAWPFWDQDGAFTRSEVVRMDADPRVQVGFRILCAPVAAAKWQVKCKDQKVARFVDATIKRFWHSPDLTRALFMLKWGALGGELVYRQDEEGHWHYDALRDFHLDDCRPLVLHNRLWGVRVYGVGRGPEAQFQQHRGRVDLPFPSAFWLANEAPYGGYYGVSRYAGAWKPWAEKRGKKGAVDVRRTWFLKSAFRGAAMRYPEGETEVDGKYISNQDLAREIVEKAEAGHVMAIPGAFDPETGKFLWEWIEPEAPAQPGGLLEYPKLLDTEILEGMGIMPEVLEAAESGSGWSGRSIPWITFLSGEDRIVQTVLSGFVRQCVRPLVDVNYGPIPFEVEPVSLVPAEMPEQGQGQGGQPGQPPTPPAPTPGAQPEGPKPTAPEALLSHEGAHAPAGGVTVQGTHYKGGQFIPGSVLARATPAEKAAVAGEAGAPAQTVRPSGRTLSQSLTAQEKSAVRVPATKVRKLADELLKVPDEYAVRTDRLRRLAAATYPSSATRESLDALAGEASRVGAELATEDTAGWPAGRQQAHELTLRLARQIGVQARRVRQGMEDAWMFGAPERAKAEKREGEGGGQEPPTFSPEAYAAVQAHARGVAKSLTSAERGAIEDYTSGLNEVTSAALRKGEMPSDREAASIIRHLDSAMAKAPPLREPVTAYRGLSFADPKAAAELAAALDAHLGGAPLTLGDYQSTSLDPGEASKFLAGHGKGKHGVLLEIEARHGLGMEGLSASGNAGTEREFLLPRGGQYEVMGKDERTVNGQKVPVYRLRQKVAAASLAHVDLADSDWQPFTGPRGGRGWKNAQTGRVVYGQKHPGQRRKRGETEERHQAATVARGDVATKAGALLKGTAKLTAEAVPGEVALVARHLRTWEVHDLLAAHGHAVGPKESKTAMLARLEAALRSRTTPAAPARVAVLPTHDLHVDPTRFQYKLNVSGPAGVGEELKGVRHWNPDLAGIVSAWRDPADGKTYVVNGHHRRELAGRLGVPDLLVRYIDAPDAKTARAKGALINIAEGRGTAVDAAKFMRDMGVSAEEMATAGISLRGAVARDAAVLARLDEGLFHRLTTGDMREAQALALASELENPADQRALATFIAKQEAKGKRVADDVVREMAKEVKATARTKEKASDLFGEYEDEKNLFLERNQLKAYVRDQLAREVGLFKAVSTEEKAKKLGTAGNVIEAEKNRQIAEQAQAARDYFDTLANRKGPLADALNELTEKYARAGKQKQKVLAEALEKLRSVMQEEIAGVGGKKGEPAAAVPPPPPPSAPPAGQPAAPSPHAAPENPGNTGQDRLTSPEEETKIPSVAQSTPAEPGKGPEGGKVDTATKIEGVPDHLVNELSRVAHLRTINPYSQDAAVGAASPDAAEWLRGNFKTFTAAVKGKKFPKPESAAPAKAAPPQPPAAPPNVGGIAKALAADKTGEPAVDLGGQRALLAAQEEMEKIVSGTKRGPVRDRMWGFAHDAALQASVPSPEELAGMDARLQGLWRDAAARPSYARVKRTGELTWGEKGYQDRLNAAVRARMGQVLAELKAGEVAQTPPAEPGKGPEGGKVEQHPAFAALQSALGRGAPEGERKAAVEGARAAGLLVALPYAFQGMRPTAEALGALPTKPGGDWYAFPNHAALARLGERHPELGVKAKMDAAAEARGRQHMDIARSLGHDPTGPGREMRSSLGMMSKEDALSRSAKLRKGETFDGEDGRRYVITAAEPPRYASRDDVAIGQKEGPAGWSVAYTIVPIAGDGSR